MEPVVILEFVSQKAQSVWSTDNTRCLWGFCEAPADLEEDCNSINYVKINSLFCKEHTKKFQHQRMCVMADCARTCYKEMRWCLSHYHEAVYFACLE